MEFKYEFFPIYVEQIEDEIFKVLSPIKKLYYFLLQSKFNKEGTFYYRDADFAAALSCSPETIKKARTEFSKNGWIKFKSGHQDKQGRGVATTYSSVKWAETPNKNEAYKGNRFAMMQRFSFEMLLDEILNNRFKHDDCLIWLCLEYWSLLNYTEGDDLQFFISKGQLKDLTGIQSQNKIDTSLSDLYYKFEFSGGSHLFEFKDKYHRYDFIKWSKWATPSESEGNYNAYKRYWDKVQNKAQQIQGKINRDTQKRELKRIGKSLTLFKNMYEKYYGVEPNITEDQALLFKKVISKVGDEKASYAIQSYFKAEQITGIYKSQRRTLGQFLKLKYWDKVS
jgi:hypothetical protein